MKKVVIIFAAVILFASCSKDEQILTENTWVVWDIKIHADSAWDRLWDMTSLSFMEDRYILQASSDCVIGRVRIKKNRIDFERTLMEPSSRSAGICEYVLSLCKYYETDGYNLTLKSNKGEIIKLIRKKPF